MTDETLATPETVAAQVPVSETKLPEQQTAPETVAESDTVPPSEEKPDIPEKPKVPFKERFNEVYAQKKQAEAEAAYARQEAGRLRAELDKLRQIPTDQATYEQQDELRMRAAVKEERLLEKEAEAQRRTEQAQEARIVAFQAKVDEARERMPDFDHVFYSVPVSEVAAELIAESSKAAEVAYFLGKNPDQAKRIYQLPAHLQGAEIARIEARVSAAPQVRKVSKAPPPVSTIGGQSSPGVKDPGQMTEAEYSAWYRQRSAKRS